MITTTTTTTDWYCHKCGKPRWSFSDSTDTHNDMCECATQEKASGEALQGWVCPVCGRMVWPDGGYEIAEFKTRWLAELFLAMLANGDMLDTEYGDVCRAKLVPLNPPPFSIN